MVLVRKPTDYTRLQAQVVGMGGVSGGEMLTRLRHVLVADALQAALLGVAEASFVAVVPIGGVGLAATGLAHHHSTTTIDHSELMRSSTSASLDMQYLVNLLALIELTKAAAESCITMLVRLC